MNHFQEERIIFMGNPERITKLSFMSELHLIYIQERFAALSDEQILHFAKKEGQLITEEAFVLLRQELVKRKLGINIILQAKQERKSEEIKKLQEGKSIKVLTKALTLVFNMKEKGVGEKDIATSLHALGFNLEASLHIVQYAQDWVRHAFEEIDNKLLSTLVKLSIAIAFFFILRTSLQIQIIAGGFIATYFILILFILSIRNDLKRIIQQQKGDSNAADN